MSLPSIKFFVKRAVFQRSAKMFPHRKGEKRKGEKRKGEKRKGEKSAL